MISVFTPWWGEERKEEGKNKLIDWTLILVRVGSQDRQQSEK